MLLNNTPNFTVGEDLVGYLSFKTESYYRLKEYQSINSEKISSGTEIDQLYMAGNLYFKCNVKEKTRVDE